MLPRFALVLGLLLAVHGWPPVAAQSTEDCMECHGEADLTTTDESGAEVSLYTDLEVFESSIHGGFDCLDCHSTIAELPHDEALPDVACGDCHDDAAAEFDQSIHHLAREEGDMLSPLCRDCHGNHNVVSSDLSSSPTNARNCVWSFLMNTTQSPSYGCAPMR